MEKAKWQTEPQYDEGIELPKGFSSWSEVLKDSFSPISSKEIESLFKLLECIQED